MSRFWPHLLTLSHIEYIKVDLISQLMTNYYS